MAKDQRTECEVGGCEDAAVDYVAMPTPNVGEVARVWLCEEHHKVMEGE